jgi:copper chaperone CopZ
MLEKNAMAKVTLHIEGMSCGHCVNAVNRALHSLPGVAVGTVQVGRAEVEVAEGGPTPEAIAEVVVAAGYPAVAVRAG